MSDLLSTDYYARQEEIPDPVSSEGAKFNDCVRLAKALRAANAKIAELTKEKEDMWERLQKTADEFVTFIHVDHAKVCTERAELEARLAAIDAQPVVAWRIEGVCGNPVANRAVLSYPSEKDEVVKRWQELGLIVTSEPLKVAKPASNPWEGFVQPKATRDDIRQSAEALRQQVEQDRIALGSPDTTQEKQS